jgi:hypothetical protein
VCRQPNTYFNPYIDTCYIALANQSYKIRLTDAGTHYIAPSDKLADNQSWTLEHLGFATTRLSRPEDLPNFPAVKFMAVDEAFLRQNQEMQTWADFFTYIPSLESFTFVVDGNTRLSRKGRHTKNWKAGTIWSSEINHPSVSISEFSRVATRLRGRTCRMLRIPNEKEYLGFSLAMYSKIAIK